MSLTSVHSPDVCDLWVWYDCPSSCGQTSGAVGFGSVAQGLYKLAKEHIKSGQLLGVNQKDYTEGSNPKKISAVRREFV